MSTSSVVAASGASRSESPPSSAADIARELFQEVVNLKDELHAIEVSLLTRIFYLLLNVIIIEVSQSLGYSTCLGCLKRIMELHASLALIST